MPLPRGAALTPARHSLAPRRARGIRAGPAPPRGCTCREPPGQTPPQARPGPQQPPVTRGSRLRINFCMWAAASMMAGAGGRGRAGGPVCLLAARAGDGGGSSGSILLVRGAAAGGPRGAELFLAQGLRGHTHAHTRGHAHAQKFPADKIPR